MKYWKTLLKDREVYTYTSLTGEKIVIKAGDCSFDDNKPVTKELIAYLHRLDDCEVSNNLKNSKPRRTAKEKEEVKKWEAMHPGEEAPKNYHISLDHFHGDPDSDMDRSSIAREIANLTQKREAKIERLYDLLDDLTEEERFCVIEIKLKKRDISEVMKELGCSMATIYRRINNALKYIEDHYFEK